MIFTSDWFRFVILTLMIAGWSFLALVLFAHALTAIVSSQPPTDEEEPAHTPERREPNV